MCLKINEFHFRFGAINLQLTFVRFIDEIDRPRTPSRFDRNHKLPKKGTRLRHNTAIELETLYKRSAPYVRDSSDKKWSNGAGKLQNNYSARLHLMAAQEGTSGKKFFALIFYYDHLKSIAAQKYAAIFRAPSSQNRSLEEKLFGRLWEAKTNVNKLERKASEMVAVG